MSGECDKCGEHCLDCICEPLRRYKQNGQIDNIYIKANSKILAITINARRKHEDIIKDRNKCKELGLDQAYETFVYLKRWGGWLED